MSFSFSELILLIHGSTLGSLAKGYSFLPIDSHILPYFYCRSDVLGQFMPMVGMDWSQTGVTHLFSAIKGQHQGILNGLCVLQENGYQLLFLSARAISQAYHTRQFLFNLKQDGKALPDGPVVISPDGVFPSLFREVIRRAPHEFKISCLELQTQAEPTESLVFWDIRALFPSDCNPFYAGFGNRNTDEISYLKVGIPKGKIFIINPKGEVAVSRRVDTKSYSSLHALVHGMFPSTTSSEQVSASKMLLDSGNRDVWSMPMLVLELFRANCGQDDGKSATAFVGSVGLVDLLVGRRSLVRVRSITSMSCFKIN
ncbi:hypothetical protein Pint_08798 [Pistacia integerrima]|uniref:Uncharacterized protein n=1 Tax=Pistacia integerrima TaxID=434235 RepID=A0ACC0XST5_9ROSI|nr:hypothetical protein Pint_08798 [Pistacia integerrima]